MKIYFVINAMSMGGAERVASRLCNEWCKENDVTIIQTSYTDATDYEIDKRINYINLCQEKRLSRFTLIKKMSVLFKDNRPDVVVSFIDTGHFYASIASKKHNIPHVCSERNDPKIVPHNIIMRFMRFFAFSRCNSIVFQTDFARRFFGKRIRKKGIVISNPIDASHIKHRSYENTLNSNTIIAVGRLVEQKNYKLLIDAFCSFKNNSKYRLKIFGRGPLAEELNTYIKNKHQSNIELCGFSHSIEDDYYNARIFAMSSTHEGLPNALMEAVASGLPCISTDASPGGPRTIISKCHGSILVENNNKDDFVKAFEKMDSNYAKMLKASMEDSCYFIKEYSSETISRQWIELFKTLVSNKKSL